MAFPVTPITFTDSTPQFRIPRSVRFDGSVSTGNYFANRVRYEGDRQRFTVSLWLKRSTLDTAQWIYGVPATLSGVGGTPIGYGLLFDSTNRLNANLLYNDSISQWQGRLVTQQQFRDTTSWYHINWSVDTTRIIPQERVKLAINGNTITSFLTGGFNEYSYPLQNSLTTFNTQFRDFNSDMISYNFNNGFNFIGGNPGGWFNGNISDINYIDGRALEPTAFGRYDENGVWVPKKYNESYGVNGFYLPFTGSTTESNLGLDANQLNSVDPFWPFTVFHLQTRATGMATDNNNVIIDSSSINASIARTGNPSQGTFNPYSLFGAAAATQAGSLYFDGNDELNAGTRPSYAFGTGNYTVEFWAYPTVEMTAANYPAGGPSFVFNDATGGFGIWNSITTGQGLRLDTRNGSVILNSGVQMPYNRWNHVAVSRNGTTVSMWLNGVRIATGGDTTNWTIQGPLKIGGISTNNFFFRGYMTGVRIVNGNALYNVSSTTITIPSTPPTNILGTVFLANFNNAAIYDATGFFNLETINSARAATPQLIYNDSSLFLDGNTLTPSVSSNATNNYLINFTTNDFTIESWIWILTLPTGTPPNANGFIVGAHNNSSSDSWCLFTNFNGTVGFFGAGGSTVTTVTPLPTRTWIHLAVVRSGNRVTIYINGVADASALVTGNYSAINNSNALDIGRRGPVNAGSSIDPFIGYLSDLRITRAARYTNNFTAPTRALPTTGSTQGAWPYGFQLGTNSEMDSVLDVPTNWGTDTGDVSGTVRGNYSTISFVDQSSNHTVSNGGLQVLMNATRPVFGSSKASIGLSTGRWYWEFIKTSTGTGLAGMGVWATDNYSRGLTSDLPGFRNLLENIALFFIDASNNLAANGLNSNPSIVGTYTLGNTIGVAFDADAGKIYFFNNSNEVTGQNIAAGTSVLPTMSAKIFNPFVYTGGGGTGTENVTVNVNFGQQPFRFVPPPGYRAVCTANINVSSTPIRAPQKFFEAVSYTGGTNVFNTDIDRGNLVLAMPLDSYNTTFDVSNEITNQVSQPKAIWGTSNVAYTSISGAQLNTTTSIIELTAHPDFDLGMIGNWTIEWSVFTTGSVGTHAAWNLNGNASVLATAPNLLLRTQFNALRYQVLTNGNSVVLNEGNSFIANNWYNYALVKNGNRLTLFRNTSATGTAIYNTVTNAGNSTIRPLISSGTTDTVHIRDFKIYKGWAKYITTTNTTGDLITQFNPATATTTIVATTGNGGDKFINLGFNPDLLWVKARNIGSTPCIIVDSTRGGNNTLSANSTNTAAICANSITFNQNGFTVGGTSGGLISNPFLNTPGATYTAYAWKRNINSGFDIVNFTKANATNESFNHGLGRVPQMFIVKGFEQSATNWNVYHSGSIFGGNNNPTNIVTLLNLVAASATNVTIWNTRPTATQFSMGNAWAAGNYVAYLFAEIPGFSRFSYYTGNGVANGPFVWCGFRPRFVMTKRVDTTGDWLIWDSSRAPFNAIVPHFSINNAFQDQSLVSPTYHGYFDFLANGFKPRLAGSDPNAIGGNFIFAAFADNPFGRTPSVPPAV